MDRIDHLLQTAGKRIGLLLAAVTLVGAALMPATAEAAVQARTAASFVDSIGIDTHTSYSNTVYASRFPELKAKLAELGVRHVREDLVPGNSGQYTRLNELAGIGIKPTLIMGSPKNGISGLESLLSTATSKLKGIDALEGPNEYYASGSANWASEDAEYQRRLWELAKANPALSSLPILGPSTVFWENGELGDVSQWLDYGNIHPYPGGYPPEEYLQRHVEYATKSSGSKPVIATETGYHNAMNWTGDFPPTSEQASATYIPRIFLDYYENGVARTFLYELVNEQPDPGLTEREDNFGLLRNDLSEKPAFVALRNLIGILKDSGASSFAPGSLSFSVGGNTEKLHKVLLQKSDGTYYLALWRATSVWDPVKQVALNPGSAPVTVSFGQSIETVERFAPNSSSASLGSFSNPSSGVSLEVGPQVTILRIVPGGTATPVESEATPTPVESEPAPAPAPAPEEETKKPSHGKKRTRVTAWTTTTAASPGDAVVVRGEVESSEEQPHEVAIQAWEGGWRTVRRSAVSSSGTFGTRVRLKSRHGARVLRLRALAAAAPSAPVRVRLKG
ncbi:MAG TPA: hypothetical protein VFS64_10320 [Solirubrobacterales bacterium]|nr:hypothetical protein [Solirubrobacterales bacterium]